MSLALVIQNASASPHFRQADPVPTAPLFTALRSDPSLPASPSGEPSLEPSLEPSGSSTVPRWQWWLTVALIPLGTWGGMVYGSRQRLSRSSPPVDEVQTPVEPSSVSVRLPRVDSTQASISALHHAASDRRRQAIWELGQQGDSRAMQPLIEAMTEADSVQRSLILGALTEIGIRTLKPINQVLLISIQDSSPTVRQNAIRDVTRVVDRVTQLVGQLHQLNQLLQAATDDADETVRDTAEWAITHYDSDRLHLESGVQPCEMFNHMEDCKTADLFLNQ